MIDLTVKTLDSRNHAFSMPDDATVQQLKAKIEDTMNIPANRQRLIFHGRVMQDDKKLSEYGVHGMVIHLVKSQPPQPGSRHGGNGSSSSAGSSDSSSRPSGARYFGRVDGSTMLGSVVIPVIGETGGGRHGAWRLMSTADRMLQRAVEVLDNHDNSASRSASVVPSVTTTPYNSSRDSSGSHSPTTETSQLGRAASESRVTAASSSASAQPSTSAGTEGMDTEMDTDSNTATPQITVSSADQTGSPSASGGSASSGSASASQEAAGQEPNPQRQQRGNPSSSNMATLLAKLQALQTRFNPLLARYHSYISEDSATNNAQQLAERLSLTQTVPEVLHLLSHAYHAISELTIDWESTPPRQMRPLLAPAIQQLVQLTEGMNPWDLTIPTAAFGQPPQAAGTANGPSAATAAAPAASASSGSSASSAAASSSSSNASSVPEVTYMTTTFPAEGGEATTTFTTRPAANFETTTGAASANASTGANPSNRTPVVTASIDFTGRNTNFTAALNAAYAIANRIAAHQVGHQHSHQQPQSQQPTQPEQAQQQQQQQQTQQQPQQQPQQGQPRGGSIVTLPVGMIDIPANVEFFMEVGPSTITIDSVEATMVTSSGFTPGTNGAATDAVNLNFPWGSPPPQAFLQGVVHALNRIITTPNANPNPNMRRRGSAPESTQNPNSQRRGSAPESENAEANPDSTPATGSTPSASSSPGAPGQTSQARGYTATNPTTSTQTRSTARPHVHHIAATQFPGYSVAYTDPFLPCHSQFFASWRRSQRNANNGSSTTANNATQTTGPAAHSTASAASQTSVTSASSASSGTGQTFIRSAVPTGAPTTSQSQQTDLNSTAPNPRVLNLMESLTNRDPSAANNAIASALNTLLSASSEENQTDVPIMNWMFPGSQQPEGESLLSDLRLAVVRNVTVSDLIALGQSDWDGLNHIRTELRRFVVQRVCEGDPPTEENLERAANLLMAELRPHFRIIQQGALREDIDAVASLDRFHESFVPEFLKLIVDEERAASFGQNLHDMVYKYSGQLWAIVKHCCANEESFEVVFQSFVNRFISDGPLAAWAARVYLGQLRLRLSTENVNVSVEDIESFLVYRTPAPEMSSPATVSSASGNSAETIGMEQPSDEPPPLMQQSILQDAVEPMDIVEPQSPSQATTSAASVVMDVPSQSNSSEEAEPPKSAEKGEAAGLSAMDSEVPPAPTPEAWHRIVPPEWVPIIARDVTRQRRPNSQPPLSDAYLAGMPPKRRKVVTADKPQGSLGEVISANMESAIQSSGVSTAGISLVQEEAGSDPRLREAYREQLRATVRANLANNQDFSPERFPNAAQYFGKS